MFIRSLTLKNFRSIDEQDFLFSKGKNFIKGENGTGKTSIGLGIIYTLTGLDGEGNKSTFHYQGNDKNAPIQATIVVENMQGQKIKISQIESATSKKIFLNNKEVKRSHLEERLSQESDVMLATIYPDYFDTLDAKKLETLLNKSTPEIDRVSLFNEKVGNDTLKKHGTLLDLVNVRSTTARATSQRLSFEKLIDNVQGQIQGIKTSGATLKETVSDKKIVIDEKRAAELEEKITKINEYNRLKPDHDRYNKAKAEQGKCQYLLDGLKEVKKPELPKTYSAKVDKYNAYIQEQAGLSSNMKSINRALEREVKLPDVDTNEATELLEEMHKIENLRIEQRAQKRALEAAKLQAQRLKGDGTKLVNDLKIHKASYEEMKKIEQFMKMLPKMEWDMKLHVFRSAIDKDITIQTEERLKNGTTKDCFKKAYKGRPYHLCSTGEKMYINRCFSDAISKVAKGKFTTRFLDNDELLTKEIDHNKLSQLFITKVVKGESLNVQGEKNA